MSGFIAQRRRTLPRHVISVSCVMLLAVAPLADAFAATRSGGGISSRPGIRLPGPALSLPLGAILPANPTGRKKRTPAQRSSVPLKNNPPPKGPKPPRTATPKPPKEAPPGKRAPKRPPIIVLPPGGPVIATPPVGGFVPPRIPLFAPQVPPPPRAAQAGMPPAGDLARSRDREVIIAVPDSVSDADVLVLGSGLALNVEVQYRSTLLALKIVRLRIPDSRSLSDVLITLQTQAANDTRVVYFQPNFVFETAQTVSRAVTAGVPQYATEKVRLPEAHRIALGRDVRVAVVDTGLDASHPELSGVVVDSFDAVGEGAATMEAHGTAIAGIVAARRQIKGMAPDARLLAVRAFAAGAGRKSEATTLSVIKGLDWAAANGARVVNMSFAGPKDQLLQLAIEAGEAKGLIFVAAAGNGGPAAASAYPAAYDRVIAVTATDSDDQLYDKANRGSYVALAAPGVDILAPAPSAAYEMSSGTSLAAAHVSGIVALMLERRPTLTTNEAREILRRTARDPGQTANARGLGAGIIDAARAVADLD